MIRRRWKGEEVYGRDWEVEIGEALQVDGRGPYALATLRKHRDLPTNTGK